jgi:adenylate cyclase
MAELEARGREPQDSWRKLLPPREVTLGRRSPNCEWETPWDTQISRLHAALEWTGKLLRVRRLQGSRNEIWFDGQDMHFQEFTVGVGQFFVIGDTHFTVLESRPSDDPAPHAEVTCSGDDLAQVQYLDPAERLAALARLPEMIRRTPAEGELERAVVQVLLRGIPQTRAAAVVRLRSEKAADSGPVVEVRAVQTSLDRDPSAFRPSRRLVQAAVSGCHSVLYRWDSPAAAPVRELTEYTLAGPDAEWALCVPLLDEASPGWGVYAAGQLPPALPEQPGDALKADLKFAELVANVFGALRQVRDLQQRLTQLGRFVSRRVLATFLEHDQKKLEEVLKARAAYVTVLFCDVRGSCQISEEAGSDLEGAWRQISEALDIMTRNITNLDGVIADFQGDAAVGFWGWPPTGRDPEEQAARQVEQAVRAALTIRRDFQRVAHLDGHPLRGFACGIGIATGAGFAGRLGTR